jgi:hypothetical protein
MSVICATRHNNVTYHYMFPVLPFYCKVTNNSPSHSIMLGYATQRGPGSPVGIVNGFLLDGPWIEFRWGRDFSHPCRPALGPIQPPIQWVTGLSLG